MSFGSPTKSEVFTVAREAIAIFASHGLSCCLVGGVACSLFGSSRTPNDVDLVVLTDEYDQETLKRMLVDRIGSKFYLVAARTPGATYKVLWYRLRSSSYSCRATDSCKVDILLPGIMNIPSVPRDKVLRIDGLPVMPLIPLILLKLQAWQDHRSAFKAYLSSKQWTDVSDLRILLPIAIRRGDSLKKETHWVPVSFTSAAKERIGWYLESYRDQAGLWKQIGVEPSRKVSTTSRSHYRRSSSMSADELADMVASERFRLVLMLEALKDVGLNCTLSMRSVLDMESEDF